MQRRRCRLYRSFDGRKTISSLLQGRMRRNKASERCYYIISVTEKNETCKNVCPLCICKSCFCCRSSYTFFTDIDVGRAYTIMFRGAFGSIFGIADVLVKTIPLVLTGLAVSVAFKCRQWNIGAEGQLFMGALGATLVGISLVGAVPGLAIFLASLLALRLDHFCSSSCYP